MQQSYKIILNLSALLSFNSIIFSPPSESLVEPARIRSGEDTTCSENIGIIINSEFLLGDSERGSFFYASLALNL